MKCPKKITMACFALLWSSCIFAQQSSIDPQIIETTFPGLNDTQQKELLNTMTSVNEKLSQNFKTMKLEPLICQGDMHYSKIHCFSRNYENHLKKEFNHYSGHKIAYGYGFSVILIHQIKPDDIPMQSQKPKFLIEEVYWNDTIESNQYQGNEVVTLGE